ncbi:hypothetical protein [uncultured Nostoc sp.]|uniref:hypothetical protein n=1 Tax=uncultured Nostoc sp. TaxID=340711 RepID=UPI0035CA9996
MQKLPAATQQVLKLASCIGSRFDSEVLAIIGEQSIEETANALVDAILRVTLGLEALKLFGVTFPYTNEEVQAAIAIDNVRLYQEAQQAQKTAERALERIATSFLEYPF